MNPGTNRFKYRSFTTLLAALVSGGHTLTLVNSLGARIGEWRKTSAGVLEMCGECDLTRVTDEFAIGAGQVIQVDAGTAVWTYGTGLVANGTITYGMPGMPRRVASSVGAETFTSWRDSYLRGPELLTGSAADWAMGSAGTLTEEPSTIGMGTALRLASPTTGTAFAYKVLTPATGIFLISGYSIHASIGSVSKGLMVGGGNSVVHFKTAANMYSESTAYGQARLNCNSGTPNEAVFNGLSLRRVLV